MPALSRITIYPIKSLDGVELDAVEVLSSGALGFDRRFAIVDSAGMPLIGKRTPLVHTIRAAYDLARQTVTLGRQGQTERATFELSSTCDALARWLSDHFGLGVTLIERAEGGFPDDPDSPGPTVAAAASYEAIAGWFEGLAPDEARRRFRANLELGDVPPFWEDRLVAAAGQGVRFRVGPLELVGTNACQRCVVPSRSSLDGAVTEQFARRFAGCRAEQLPSWAERFNYDHFFRFAVNTRRADEGEVRVIRRGDPVEIVAVEPLA